MTKRQRDKYYFIRYQSNGKQIEEGLGWLSEGMSVDEASAIRGQIIQNIRKGIRPQSVAEMRSMDAEQRAEEAAQRAAEERSVVTFGAMAELFLEWSRNNKKSYRDDENRYKKHLERQFKNMPIKDISPFHLEKIKATLKKKQRSPATVVQLLQLVRVIFNKTRAWGEHECPFPAVNFPKSDSRRVAFLTPEQADTLLSTIKGKSLKLWGQCVLSLYAGLRFGEIAALELSDIDLDAGTIHIRDAKAGTRHAYLTEPIRAMLDELWSTYGKRPGLIFPARPGRKKRAGDRQDRVSPVFARTVADLGFNDGIPDRRQKIVFHSLRHSFASWLVMGGENLNTVMELMGHADISTTMRYSHLMPDVKRGAAARLVETLSVQPEDVVEFRGGAS